MRALAIALLAAAACGGTPATVDGNPGGQVFDLAWGPVVAQPYQEDTRCVTLDLGNDIPVEIHTIHNTLGPASHHMIVYKLAMGTVNTTPTPCTPFVDTLDPSMGAPLMISQKADDLLTYPDGVAITLQPHQLIRLELHFINSTPNPVTVTAQSELSAMADADFQNEANLLFIGNPDIRLASSPDTQTLGPTWFQVPASLDGVNVFAITGHEHKLGTGVQVDVAASSTDTGTSVYAPVPFTWSEPATTYHDPPFQIPQNGGFHFTCEWINDTGAQVNFGESAENEMCFFWAYYYPSQGAKVCFHSSIYTANPLDICCPDDAVDCALLQSYLGQLGH
jgi:hypothetical protein